MLEEKDFKLDIEDGILYMVRDVLPLSEISNFELYYYQRTEFNDSYKERRPVNSMIIIRLSNKDGKNIAEQRINYPNKDIETISDKEIKQYQRYVAKQLFLPSFNLNKPEKLLLK